MQGKGRRLCISLIVAIIFISYGVISYGIIWAFQERIANDKIPPEVARSESLCPPIPEKYRNLRNPLKRDENNLNRGERLYDINCSPCHGGNLDGNGPEARGFFPPPANLLHLVSTIKPPESYLFWRIKEGGPGLPMHWRPWDSAMPVWKYELTDVEIWQIILYIYEATGESPP